MIDSIVRENPSEWRTSREWYERGKVKDDDDTLARHAAPAAFYKSPAGGGISRPSVTLHNCQKQDGVSFSCRSAGGYSKQGNGIFIGVPKDTESAVLR